VLQPASWLASGASPRDPQRSKSSNRDDSTSGGRSDSATSVIRTPPLDFRLQPRYSDVEPFLGDRIQGRARIEETIAQTWQSSDEAARAAMFGRDHWEWHARGGAPVTHAQI
jgi:hypothetical protein